MWNIYNKILLIGGAGLRKGSPKYNKYLKRRIASTEKKRLKRIRNQVRPSVIVASKHLSIDINKPDLYTSHVPEHFSIKDNSEETIGYFNELIRTIIGGSRNKRIHFDFKNVCIMTIDALMYLLAIIKNISNSEQRVMAFTGDIPIKDEPKDLFMRSGFLTWVTSKVASIRPDPHTIRIFWDKDAEITAPKKIVDFIVSSTGVNRSETAFLYEMIVELEANAQEHAYMEGVSRIFEKNWFAFVEETDVAFCFTFLDTGLGIPKTINKQWHEKLLGKTQSGFIISALDGELRSRTTLSTRGNGLPRVKLLSDSGKIEKLAIISQKARCHAAGDGDHTIMGNTQRESLRGTMYYWEVSKVNLGLTTIRSA